MARIVLVHGAFSGAWCWEPVLPGLRAAGHTAQTVELQWISRTDELVAALDGLAAGR